MARHSYNWGLVTCFQALENNEKLPTAIDLHKKLVAEVKSVYPWYYEVSKCAPQQALRICPLPLKIGGLINTRKNLDSRKKEDMIVSIWKAQLESV